MCGTTRSHNVKKKVFSFIFFLTCLAPRAHSLALSQLLTEIRVRIKDTSTSRQRYTDTQLTNLINEAQRDVVNVTWPIESTQTFVTVAGTAYYALNTDMIVISRVTSASTVLPETTLIQLDSVNGSSPWSTLSGTFAQNYFIDRSQHSSSQDMIGIYPIPKDNKSTTTITVYYYQQSLDVAVSTDVPFHNIARLQTYDDLLVYYPSAIVYTIEGEADKSKAYMDLYTARLQNMYQAIGKKPNYLPSFGGPSGSR